MVPSALIDARSTVRAEMPTICICPESNTAAPEAVTPIAALSAQLRRSALFSMRERLVSLARQVH